MAGLNTRFQQAQMSGADRVLSMEDSIADGRVSRRLRSLVPRTSGVRRTAVGGDLIRIGSPQSRPGQHRSLEVVAQFSGLRSVAAGCAGRKLCGQRPRIQRPTS